MQICSFSCSTWRHSGADFEGASQQQRSQRGCFNPLHFPSQIPGIPQRAHSWDHQNYIGKNLISTHPKLIAINLTVHYHINTMYIPIYISVLYIYILTLFRTMTMYISIEIYIYDLYFDAGSDGESGAASCIVVFLSSFVASDPCIMGWICWWISRQSRAKCRYVSSVKAQN